MPFFRPLALVACLATSAVASEGDDRLVTGQISVAGSFGHCLQRLQNDAARNGISAQTFRRAMPYLQPDAGLLRLLDGQPEFQKQPWEYIGGAVTEGRVAQGRTLLARHKALFDAVENRFGVSRYVLAAIWGMETNFGQGKGNKHVLRSTATLACQGRRQEFFGGEFLSALMVVQKGHIAPEQFIGSWAGAFGNTQFMPSTFLKAAVDFDGDGHADIIGSIADAMASTANYLKSEGWRGGMSWGYEVSLPKGFDYRLSGEAGERPLTQWAQLGVRRANGSALPASREAAVLIVPAGATGPLFLATGNFKALTAYNNSENYVLSVGHLADRLAGGGGFHGQWPLHERGLPRHERVELQQRLAQAGVYSGNADGQLGRKTREAVKLFQVKAGLLPDGFPTRRVLAALRERR